MKRIEEKRQSYFVATLVEVLLIVLWFLGLVVIVIFLGVYLWGDYLVKNIFKRAKNLVMKRPAF